MKTCLSCHKRQNRDLHKNNYFPKETSSVSKSCQVRKKFNMRRWTWEEELLGYWETWRRKSTSQEILLILLKDNRQRKGFLQYVKTQQVKRKRASYLEWLRGKSRKKKRKWSAILMKKATSWMQMATTSWITMGIMQGYHQKRSNNMCNMRIDFDFLIFLNIFLRWRWGNRIKGNKQVNYCCRPN